MNVLKKLLAALTNKPSTNRKLLYAINGRDGHIIYKDPQGEITFYFEFGGGEVVAIITVPAASNWTKETKRPLAQRNEIIEFTAQQAVKDNAPSCKYRVKDAWIEIYKE